MDRILLSHGGGGRKTEELIKEVFHKYIDDPLIKCMDDGALIDDLVFTTDSFVVNPIFFPGGDIGRLAVSGTVNDLCVMGAKPLYLSIGFIIEEGFEIKNLEKILKSIKDSVDEVGMRIVTGDTKVVEKGKGDGMFINTSGIGRVVFKNVPSLKRITEGDLVIINGPIGLHGISVILARESFGLEAEVYSDVIPLWSLIEELKDFNVKFMRDPTRGGVAQVFNEMVKGQNFGIEIWEDKIPVTEKVTAVCDILGFDPLYIANEGKVIIVVSEQDAEKVLEKMRSNSLGQKAEIVGRIIDKPDIVVLKTTFGSERIVMPPIGEVLPRIC